MAGGAFLLGGGGDLIARLQVDGAHDRCDVAVGGDIVLEHHETEPPWLTGGEIPGSLIEPDGRPATREGRDGEQQKRGENNDC